MTTLVRQVPRQKSLDVGWRFAASGRKAL